MTEEFDRRTTLAAIAAVFAVAGAFLFARLKGDNLTDVWPPILLGSTLPAAIAALWHERRGQRALCVVAVTVSGLLALVLMPYGYGIFQLPALVTLAAAIGPSSRVRT